MLDILRLFRHWIAVGFCVWFAIFMAPPLVIVGVMSIVNRLRGRRDDGND